MPDPSPHRLHIRPAEGLLVIDPASQRALPKDGAEVELSRYWRRRLKDGDVLSVLPETTAIPAKPAKTTKASKKED